MKDEKKKDDEEDIEVRFKPGSDEKTRVVASQLQELFNGPLFARMVREAVEEMILEGKLTYDLETDELGVPEDIVKRWSARMEMEVWSGKRKEGSSSSEE